MEKASSGTCFYGILGLNKESSAKDIRISYRKLAKKWHPDKCATMAGEARENAKLKFQEIQEAYEVLSNQNRRFLYDAGLHEECDGDYGMQDFIGELITLMNNDPCPSTAQSDDVEEVQDTMKLFPGLFDVMPNWQEVTQASPLWSASEVHTRR